MLHRLPQQFDLCRAAGRGKRSGAAVLPHGRSLQLERWRLTRLGARIEDKHATALAAYETVRSRVKGLAPAVDRGHTGRGERHGGEREEDERCRSSDRGLGQPGTQLHRRRVQRDEGGGARRVDGKARTCQPEAVRDAPGRHRDGGGGAKRRSAQVNLTSGDHDAVVVILNAERDAHVLTTDTALGVSRVVKRLVRNLQDHPLLRVHGTRLGVRNAERAVVEGLCTIDKRAPAHGLLALFGQRLHERPGVIVPVPARERHLAHCVASRQLQRLVRADCRPHAWNARSRARDRNLDQWRDPACARFRARGHSAARHGALRGGGQLGMQVCCDRLSRRVLEYERGRELDARLLLQLGRELRRANRVESGLHDWTTGQDALAARQRAHHREHHRLQLRNAANLHQRPSCLRQRQ